MPITYSIDKGKLWFEAALAGEVTAEEIQTYLTRLLADPDYSEELSGVIDCRSLTILLGVNEFQTLTNRPAPVQRAGRRSKRAVVVASSEQYGVARMFTVLSEGGPVQYDVFHSLTPALQWLRY